MEGDSLLACCTFYYSMASLGPKIFICSFFVWVTVQNFLFAAFFIWVTQPKFTFATFLYG